uniref:Uncharacterized protein n=1 Tax=Anguilla anguilla TaxID=7936 RepID=A0A0E9VVD9_ANGAN
MVLQLLPVNLIAGLWRNIECGALCGHKKRDSLFSMGRL